MASAWTRSGKGWMVAYFFEEACNALAVVALRVAEVDDRRRNPAVWRRQLQDRGVSKKLPPRNTWGPPRTSNGSTRNCVRRSALHSPPTVRMRRSRRVWGFSPRCGSEAPPNRPRRNRTRRKLALGSSSGARPSCCRSGLGRYHRAPGPRACCALLHGSARDDDAHVPHGRRRRRRRH